MDPRFREGVSGPGRPTADGAGAPRPAAPKPPQPTAPAVATAPVGRPAGAVQKPATPGPGAPAPAVQAAMGAMKPAAPPTTWAQAAGAPTAPWQAAINGTSGGFLSPEQQMRAAAVQEAPAKASQAAATNHFEGLQASLQGAIQPAPAPAPAPAPQPAPAAAPSGGGGGGWSESMSSTNITGGVGDPEVDAALKAAVMSNLQKDPYSPEVIASEQARARDEGMAGLGSELESIEGDAVRRGISRGGAGAALGSEARQRAQASVANNQRQIMTDFAKLSDEHKQQAIGAAQNLATDLANRGISLQQLALQRAGSGGGGGRGKEMLTMMDDEGNSFEIDPDLVDLVLGLGEGGYE